MERDRSDEGVVDGTGLDRPDDVTAMPSAKELTDHETGSDEATGGEKTAVEGLSGIGATNRAFGGGAMNAAGGIGTHVMTDADEHVSDTSEGEANDPGGSTDPRGY
jgi:hypothetical protein